MTTVNALNTTDVFGLAQQVGPGGRPPRHGGIVSYALDANVLLAAARCSAAGGVTNVPDWVHPVASQFGTFEEED